MRPAFPVLMCLLLAAIRPAAPAAVHTIPAEMAAFDAQAVAPGDEILIPPGPRGPLRLARLRGEPGRPVVVRSAGPDTLIDGGATAYALKIVDSREFRLTGKPHPLEIAGGGCGVQITGYSTDFEVDHLLIRDARFAGLMAKLDPTADPRTWRGAFTMRDVVIRDNVILRTGGEGLYIGNSFHHRGHRLSDGRRVPPHDITGLRVLRNRTDDTGCEGIQVGAATKDCTVADNLIERFGRRPFARYQDNGLQLGEGTQATVGGNTVRDGPGNGIILLGPGGAVTGNTVERVGGHGIYATTRHAPAGAPGYVIANNIIRDTARRAIAVDPPTARREAGETTARP